MKTGDHNDTTRDAAGAARRGADPDGRRFLGGSQPSPRTELAQKCCLLEGFTQFLSFMPGDFAVVLHSEPDCANLVYRDSRVADPSRFLCTNLSEADAIAGLGRERLLGAIREGASLRARTIFVLGGCVASLIGDDVEEIGRAAGLGAGVRVVALNAPAFRMFGQAEIIDVFTGLLAGGAPSVARQHDSVNLVGFPDDGGETSTFLRRAGVRVNSWPGPGTAIEEWLRLPAGALTVVPELRVFGRLAAVLRDQHGGGVIEVPPPVGVGATAAFHRAIGGRFGKAALIEKVLKRGMAVADRAVTEFRHVNRGRRLAYHVGGRKDFSFDTVTWEGLAWVPMFRELGFEMVLFFQGAVEERARRRVAGMLASYGIDLPFRMLRDRISLTAALRDEGLSAVYCSDSFREEARAAGAALIPAGSLRPGFSGAVAAAAGLGAILGPRAARRSAPRGAARGRRC